MGDGWLELAAGGLYWACVDFMIHTANLAGVTYRDTNSLMFFLLWPGVTLGLLLLVLWQGATLGWRRRRSGVESRCRGGR